MRIPCKTMVCEICGALVRVGPSEWALRVPSPPTLGRKVGVS